VFLALFKFEYLLASLTTLYLDYLVIIMQ